MTRLSYLRHLLPAMHALSLGPHRGADWLGRSAIGGREAGVGIERYVVRLWDPKHSRSVWLCLGLDGTGQAQCLVETFSPEAEDNRSAQEAWPLERTTLDPERAGIGVGECQVQPESTHGLVRGGNFSVAWRCTFSGGSGPVSLLRRSSLYRPRRLSHKAAMLTVGATVQSGELEIWHETGRAARVSRIPLAGWRASVHHVWGRSAFEHFALWDHFSSSTSPTLPCAATTYATTLFGLRRLQPQQGVVVQGETCTPFDGRHSLWRRHDRPFAAEGRWPVSLETADVQLHGVVHVPAHAPQRRVSCLGEQLVVTDQAVFEGSLQTVTATSPSVRWERGLLEFSA